MNELATTNRKRAPFGEAIPLFRNLPERQVADLMERSQTTGEEVTPSHPVMRPILQSVRKAMTLYGRYGTTTEDGAIDPSLAYTESGGGNITRDKEPDFFETRRTHRGTKEYIPDTAYMDVMSPLKMTDVTEEMDEWDAYMNFVLMKEAGQVKYGKLAAESRSIRNDEWGAGIAIQWTWFETNKFGIKMNRLAPKFKYDYFNQMADQVYGLWSTTAVSASRDFATVVGSAMTQHVVRDFNTAMLTLMGYQNTLLRYPFDNAQFRIVAPYSAWWWLDQAFRSARTDVNATHFFREPSVTFTNKLTQLGGDPNLVYLFVENWEQNVLTTRVPLTAHGPQDDIDVFAQKMSYRGAYGANIDSNSFITMQFNPAAAGFVAQGIVRTDEMP